MTSSRRIACGRCGEWAIEPRVALSRTDSHTILCPDSGLREATSIPDGWPLRSLSERIAKLEKALHAEQANTAIERDEAYELGWKTCAKDLAKAKKEYRDLFDAYNEAVREWAERERYLEAALMQSVTGGWTLCQHPRRHHYETGGQDGEPVARCMTCKKVFYGYERCKCGEVRSLQE